MAAAFGGRVLAIGIERDEVARIGALQHVADAGLQSGALPQVDGVAHDDGSRCLGLRRGAVLRAVIDDDDMGEGPAGLLDDAADDLSLVVQRNHEPGIRQLVGMRLF